MNDAITREQMYSTTFARHDASNSVELKGKKKNTNLFINWVSIPKYQVAANEAGEEGVKRSLFATVRPLLD